MSTKLETREDPDAETVLEFVDAEWVVKDITLDEIDESASANNSARLWEPLNSVKIEEYHQSMSRGDVFPMIVVEASAKGFVILGGNQRAAAMRRFEDPVETVAAYVVRPLTDAFRDVVIRSLNSRHGWGSDKEERIEHAVFMVRKHGISTADAARLMVVSESTITMHIRAEDTRAELARKGVDSTSLPLSTLTALSRLNHSKARVQIAETAVKCKSTADEVLNVVKSVDKASSDSGRNNAVRSFRKSAESSIKMQGKGKSGRIRRPRREKFLRLLENMSTFLERENDGTGFSSLDELQCNTDEDRQKVIAMSQKILIRLKTISGA